MANSELDAPKLRSVDQDPGGQLVLVISDGRKFPVSVKLWDQLKLSPEQRLTPEQLATIEEESEYVRISQKGLDLLARRDHSEQELKRKLLSRFHESERLVGRFLEEMKDRGFQSDDRFARLFVESRLGKRKHGPFLILAELRERGISKDLAQSVLEELADPEFWLARVQQNLEELMQTGKFVNRAKLGQKLFQRGFPRDLIEEALADTGLKRF